MEPQNPFHLQFQLGDETHHLDFLSEGTSPSAASVMVEGRTYCVCGSEQSIDFLQRLLQESSGDAPSLTAEEALIGKLKRFSAGRIFISNLGPLFFKPFSVESSIQNIGRLLEELYIFPGVAQSCKDYLLAQRQKGKYRALSSLHAFAERLTHDLYRIAGDKHLSVRFGHLEEEELETVEQRLLQFEKEHYGLISRQNAMAEGLLKEGELERVSFLGLSSFKGVNQGEDDYDKYGQAYDVVRREIMSAMHHMRRENPKVVVLDMRQNCGGSPYAVALLCSYFLRENTLFNTIETRKGESLEV